MAHENKILLKLEALKTQVDEFSKEEFNQSVDNIIKDYQRKDRRLEKIVHQGDKQQMEVLKLNEELERTHLALRENQTIVEKAKETAELATQAKSDFLANMSHEIRTPMNAILGMSYLALQTDLNKKQKNYIAKVNHAAESLLGIINDILDFSKIESGKMAIESIPFSLAEVFKDLESILAFKTDEKKLNLNIHVDPDIPHHLIGDPLRLSQILINLGNNALKFTSQGSITISAQLLVQKNNQFKVQFSVVDTGIGISKTQQEHLFQSFSQADSSTTRKYGGTGLGLSISKQLVDLMQGEIWIESKLDKGSSFLFNLFFTPCSEQQIIQTTLINKDKLENSLQQLQGARILLVEDNELNQELALELLRSKKLQVDLANNGQEAISILASDSHYDAILMDIQMPIMGGYEATRRIRQDIDSNNLPIIAMTANVMEDDIREIYRVGMDDHITKPINVNQMFLTLAKWIAVKNRQIDTAINNSAMRLEPRHFEIPPEAFNLFKGSSIDTKLGLSISQHNTALYHKLLTHFLKQNKNFIDVFMHADIRADPQVKIRMAHSLKSSAGNIGAETLYQACQQLETACSDSADKQSITNNLNEVSIILTPIISIIEKYQDNQLRLKAKSSIQNKAIDINAYSESLKTLSELFSYNDPEAIDILEGLIETFESSNYLAQLEEIQQAANQYDFDQAMELLELFITGIKN